MADYKNTGRTWVNKNKQEGDKKPPFTGKGNYNGTEFEVGLWINDDGTHYMKFSEPYVKESSNKGSWEQQREKFAVKKQDNLPTDNEVDEPIDLSDIPF